MAVGIYVPYYFSGPFGQRCTAEATCAYRINLAAGCCKTAAADGGIGGHNSCKPCGGDYFYNVVQLLVSKVGGYLQQYGFTAAFLLVQRL